MADIYKIYSGDYLKEGYDQGIEDRKKTSLSFLKQLILSNESI